MSNIFDANSRVVISGIDSAMAQRQCREMLANGTRLIGAIKGSKPVDIEGLTLFNRLPRRPKRELTRRCISTQLLKRAPQLRPGLQQVYLRTFA